MAESVVACLITELCVLRRDTEIVCQRVVRTVVVDSEDFRPGSSRENFPMQRESQKRYLMPHFDCAVCVFECKVPGSFPYCRLLLQLDIQAVPRQSQSSPRQSRPASTSSPLPRRCRSTARDTSGISSFKPTTCLWIGESHAIDHLTSFLYFHDDHFAPKRLSLTSGCSCWHCIRLQRYLIKH